MRNFGAAIAGLISAFLAVYLVQTFGHSLYPPPPDLDIRNPEAMRTFISTQPVVVLLIPMFAYFIGTFTGTVLASTIGDARPTIFAAIVGTLILAGTIANLILIPHPLWFSVIAIMGIVGSAWLATLLVSGKSAEQQR